MGTDDGGLSFRSVKAVERRFGEEGRKVCIEALIKVGRQVGKDFFKAATIPEGLSEIEMISS